MKRRSAQPSKDHKQAIWAEPKPKKSEPLKEVSKLRFSAATEGCKKAYLMARRNKSMTSRSLAEVRMFCKSELSLRPKQLVKVRTIIKRAADFVVNELSPSPVIFWGDNVDKEEGDSYMYA